MLKYSHIHGIWAGWNVMVTKDGNGIFTSLIIRQVYVMVARYGAEAF